MKAQSVSIPGLTIACKTWGNPDKPAVLALHGWLDNANSFDPLAELVKNDYYFIAMDFPGHGHSSHLPAGAHYHFIDGLYIVIEVLNALGLDKVHLLGHSMGACLASLVAGVSPQRFLSVGLIEGLGPFSAPEDTACKQLTNYIQYLNLQDKKQSKGYSHLDSAAKARALKGYVSFDIAKKLVERGIKEEQGFYSWRHDRRLLVPSPLRMTEAQIISCLKEITAKTCLIFAEDGYDFDSELIRDRINAVAHMKLKRLDGGHHIHMEKPNEIAEILLELWG